ncbi:MAG TPA: glycosyltransferase family 9 protein [Flavipsychrobacter sp.]|nr:glycosyltransferase family 9 protein [Flavipsychrobacter sp.]
MKILIIRFSSIGDIVLTTPVIRCLKKQRPDIELHYLTKHSFEPVLVNNPYIDRLHLLKDNLPEITETLQKENFDQIIDLHHNLRTLKVKRALNKPSYSFNKLNVQKWLLVNLKINTMPPQSIVERYLATVKHLGVKNDGLGLDYFIPKEKEVTTKDLPMSHWAGYVGCVIGGSYTTKKLPVEKWKELIAQIQYPILLLGGASDREEGERIAALDPVKIYNSCGKFDLNESASLVKNAKTIVSNDTGLMHVAAAFQKPILSLWGNTSPEMGMFPYFGSNDVNNIVLRGFMLENQSLSCHPCSKIGYDRCPKRHFKCMNDLDMTHAAALVTEWNKKAPAN